MIDSGAMPAKKKASHSEQEASYAVGDRLKVNLHTGRIVDAIIKAVIERTDGKRLEPSGESGLGHCANDVVEDCVHIAAQVCDFRQACQLERTEIGVGCPKQEIQTRSWH
jgi:hypothetical protein